MPKSIGTICNASRSHLAVKARCQHIWISDDILSETFNAFVHNHKRYGSNVPGPLEARKRNSKRRATHLAHPSATSYTPESFGLFDTRSQQGWWQKEQNLPGQQSSGWHWPFILPRVARGPPPPPVPTTQELEWNTIGTERDALRDEKTEDTLRGCLREIRTHTGLVDVLSELLINLRNTPHIAELSLKQVLAQNWEQEEVIEFLLDPRTNPPGAENHVYVLQQSQRFPSLTRKLLSDDVLNKAARLGLLSISEIQQIILLVPTIDPTIFPSNMTWASFCCQLLDAIESSKVLGLQDLEDNFIQRWLNDSLLSPYCPSVPELLWRVQKHIGLPDEQALEAVIYSSLSMFKGSTTVHLRTLVDFLMSHPHEVLRSFVFRFTQRLAVEAGRNDYAPATTNSLEQQVDWSFRELLLERAGGAELSTSDTIAGVVQNSTRHNRYLQRSARPMTGLNAPSTSPNSSEVDLLSQQRLNKASRLELWYAILANLGCSRVGQINMDADALKAFITASPHDTDPHQYSLNALWTMMALSVRDDTAVSLIHLSDAIAEELCRAFPPASEQGPEDILARVHQALQLSPLPAKNKFIRRLSTLSGKYLNVKQNYWSLAHHLDNLENARILELRDDLAYRSIKHHFPAKLTEIAECLNSDMAKFEETCLNIIKHVKGSISIVFRLLTHNRELKLALRQAAILMHSGPYRWNNIAAASQPALGGYSYLELVDMINNIARELAHSEHLSPRNALRKVFWIRGFLIDCQAPTKPPIARALWHAGVTRHSSAGSEPSYHNIRWLYGEVKHIEGVAVADNLLRTSGGVDIPDLHNGPKTDLAKLCQEFPVHASSQYHVKEGRLLSKHHAAAAFRVPNTKTHADHQDFAQGMGYKSTDAKIPVSATSVSIGNTKVAKKPKRRVSERKDEMDLLESRLVPR